jgi:transposase
VAIETASNLLVDFLWLYQYQLYVVAPNQVKASRGRQRVSGAHNDASDAALLAEMVHNDRKRLIPWQPDGALVRNLRYQLSFVDDLTMSLIQYGNRLRALLLRYYPQAVTLFSDLVAPVSLHFLLAYPTPAAASQLSYESFCAFCRQQGYTHWSHLPRRYAHLQRPAAEADPAVVTALSVQTPWLAELLLTLYEQKRQGLHQVHTLFAAHPDAFIFASLPGAGPLLAPKLLAIFGDHRARFPTADIVRGLAGTCPITIQSGGGRVVRFRQACNHSWRTAAQQFAQLSTQYSPWAAAYFDQARQRGLSKSHAYRALANRWLGIMWTLWQRREAYDESYHQQQVHIYRRAQRA